MPAIPAFVEARRSIRAFRADPVPAELLDSLVAAACLAPAPHHSRPWRWVVLADHDRQAALADGMGARWRADLAGDGVPPARVDELVGGSRRRLLAAPAAVLGCLTDEGLDRYPDERRQRAEWGMALLALGAAVENLMLAAADAGLASCWVAAPIFCPEEAGAALGLDAGLAAPRARPGRLPRPQLRGPAPTAGGPRHPAGPVGQRPRRWPRNQATVRVTPSSRDVQGCQPSCPPARDASSAERRSSPARAGRARAGSWNPTAPAMRS